MREVLRLELFGGMRVSVGDAPLELPYAKSSALLAYLAATRRRHTREALSTLLWGESREKQARASLRTALWHLREAVDAYLVVERNSVVFNQEAPHWVDAAHFEERVETVRRRAGLGAAADDLSPVSEHQAEMLREAVQLYRGEFLAGNSVRGAPVYEAWTLQQREWAREEVIWALHTLVSHYTARGEHGMGLDAVAQLLVIAPWQEEAHRERMLLLALSGERRAALAQYDACRTVLAEALDAEPTLETELLYREIKAGRPPSASPARARPVRLNVPPWCPSPVYDDQALLGRDSDSARLKRLLLASDVRLTSLVGPDGVGKTRLAWDTAGAVARRFEDGIWFVSCSPPQCECGVQDSGARRSTRRRGGGDRSDQGLACSLGRALGLTFSSAIPIAAQVGDYLGRREVLLVVDGVGPSPAQRDFLLGLLRQAPRLEMLVIGRRPLGVETEEVLSLEGLACPPWSGDGGASAQELERIKGYDSVRLFVERARLVDPAFEASAAVAPHVVEICRLASGQPLAIELAAALVGKVPVDALADDVAWRLRGMTEEASAGTGRPETATFFSLVWDFLSSEDQVALACLAAFPGGFGGAAALEVCDVSARRMQALCGKALVTCTATERYWVHPLIRQLVLRRVGHGGVGQEVARPSLALSRAGRRRTHFYLGKLEQCGERLRGQEAKTASAEIQRDWLQIRAAWCGAAEASDLDGLERALEGLTRFTRLTGWFWESSQLLTTAASGLLSEGRDRESAAHLALACRLLTEKARFVNAQMRYGEAVDVCLRVVNLVDGGSGQELPAEARDELLARAHLEWAKAIYPSGQLDSAKNHVARALALAPIQADPWIEAACLQALGIIEIEGERFEEAESALEQASDIQDSLNDRLGKSETLRALSAVRIGNRAHDEAETAAVEALTISETMGDVLGEAAGHALLGRIARARGDHVSANVHYGRALEKAREVGDRRTEGHALRELAWNLLEDGRMERAWSYALLAAELANVAGHTSDQADASLVAGHVFARLRRSAQAADSYERALKIHRQLSQLDAATESLAGLASLSLVDGEFGRAQDLVDQILEQARVRQLAGARDPMLVYLTCYEVLRMTGDDRAETVLRTASQIYEGRRRGVA